MDYIQSYFDFMKEATTAVQAASAVEARLIDQTFTELKMEEEWSIVAGGKYYVRPYPTSLIAFTLGRKAFLTKGFKIISAHTDNPGFRIKPNPEVLNEGMITLNVEKYGGPIFSTWFDRPLSVAGRIAIRSDQVLKPEVKFIDVKRPILTLPNIAIHMNRQVNTGKEIKVQKEMQPLLASLIDQEVKKDYFLNLIAKEAGVKAKDILDADLHVYSCEEGMLVGANEEYISCPRIDDLSMVYAAMEALIAAKHEDGINMGVFMDSEEIGSQTRQGADSMTLANIVERIRMALNRTPEEFARQLIDSFIISADGAHGLHPNYSEKNDITTKPVMNKGITVKISGMRSYASEVETIGAFQQVCDQAGVPYQKFVNHSDVQGGGTLGPIVSRYLPVDTVDVGLPMLAMHSTRELMGKEDFLDSIKVFKTFFNLI